MKRLYTLGFAALAACTTALAGTQEPVKDVDISSSIPGTFTATGIPAWARSSEDSNQAIGCTVVKTEGFDDPVVECYARRSNGLEAKCLSNDRDMVNMVTGIQPYSVITFVQDANNGDRCSQLRIRNDSRWMPARPYVFGDGFE